MKLNEIKEKVRVYIIKLSNLIRQAQVTIYFLVTHQAQLLIGRSCYPTCVAIELLIYSNTIRNYIINGKYTIKKLANLIKPSHVYAQAL